MKVKEKKKDPYNKFLFECLKQKEISEDKRRVILVKITLMFSMSDRNNKFILIKEIKGR